MLEKTSLPFKFQREHLVESCDVLVKRDVWYVVITSPKLDTPENSLVWFRVRHMQSGSGDILPLRDELNGQRCYATSNRYRLVELPSYYQNEYGAYTGLIITEPVAEFVETVPVPTPPGRIPYEWRDGYWYRCTARRREKYTAAGWVALY